MKEILRSQNLFELKIIQQLLSDYEIQAVIMDEHSGSLMSGIGNILPRLMVLEDDLDKAKQLIERHQNDL